MSQRDVLDFLREQQQKTPNKWFTKEEVKTGLQNNNGEKSNQRRTTNHLFTLAQFCLIEVKGVGIWKHKKYFRFKI